MRKQAAILMFFFALGAPISAKAAVAGALESFPTLAHAESWAVFDFADETTYYPFWSDEDDPFIYLTHIDDYGLWFLTDLTGNRAWIGDYSEESIQAIQVEIFIDSLEELDLIDCAIWTDGSAGFDYYYSEALIASDFPEAGWWQLRFPFDGTWFYFDDGWIPVTFEPEDLREVEEIGFRIFPKTGAPNGLLSAIGEVRLEPLVVAPEIAFDQDGSNFILDFEPLPGTVSSIEKLLLQPDPEWQTVPGETEIRGIGTYRFESTLSENRGIFRVVTEADYQQVEIE
ncbi:MAG TPA: hypothetical protein VK041_01885 [Opitutales bacterium]|nr:hypothetical protein [Opitutales bacterium]